AAILARETLAEAAQYLPGGLAHKALIRAAWHQHQMGIGIAACDWNDEPPADFGPEYFNDNRRAA
ncbi:hypothetical protein NM680_13260, partial [Paracoccus sp. PS-1]|uniref:hypothetical protein n=1 Tax=Paracoccus sp. PS1 TaxID=2963938 RepID=UPI0027E46F05